MLMFSSRATTSLEFQQFLSGRYVACVLRCKKPMNIISNSVFLFYLFASAHFEVSSLSIKIRIHIQFHDNVTFEKRMLKDGRFLSKKV